MFPNTQVCSVCPSLVCLSICGNIIRYASRAKMKTSHSLERLPPPLFSLPLLSETYDKKTASTRTFPSPRPLRSLASPTLITSWDLTAGWGRLGIQKWTQSCCTVAAWLPWAWAWSLFPWICHSAQVHCCTRGSWPQVFCPPTCPSLCQRFTLSSTWDRNLGHEAEVGCSAGGPSPFLLCSYSLGVPVFHISPGMLEKCLALFPPPISICKVRNRERHPQHFVFLLTYFLCIFNRHLYGKRGSKHWVHGNQVEFTSDSPAIQFIREKWLAKILLGLAHLSECKVPLFLL